MNWYIFSDKFGNFPMVLLILMITQSSIVECSESIEYSGSDIKSSSASNPMTECHLRPVIHILQRSGCIPKPIPSFACYGTCNSYVQISTSRFWQIERSCNCCQEIGEREASITLYCPKQTPHYRKVTTRAPVECLCRPCSAVDEQQIKPLEMQQK